MSYIYIYVLCVGVYVYIYIYIYIHTPTAETLLTYLSTYRSPIPARIEHLT